MNLIKKFKQKFEKELLLAKHANIKSRRYSREFKQEVVSLLRSGISAKIIQNEIHVVHSSISTWNKKYQTEVCHNYNIECKNKNGQSEFVELKMATTSSIPTINSTRNNKAIIQFEDNESNTQHYSIVSPSGYTIHSLTKSALVSIIQALESSLTIQ